MKDLRLNGSVAARRWSERRGPAGIEMPSYADEASEAEQGDAPVRVRRDAVLGV